MGWFSASTVLAAATLLAAPGCSTADIQYLNESSCLQVNGVWFLSANTGVASNWSEGNDTGFFSASASIDGPEPMIGSGSVEEYLDDTTCTKGHEVEIRYCNGSSPADVEAGAINTCTDQNVLQKSLSRSSMIDEENQPSVTCTDFTRYHLVKPAGSCSTFAHALSHNLFSALYQVPAVGAGVFGSQEWEDSQNYVDRLYCPWQSDYLATAARDEAGCGEIAKAINHCLSNPTSNECRTESKSCISFQCPLGTTPKAVPQQPARRSRRRWCEDECDRYQCCDSTPMVPVQVCDSFNCGAAGKDQKYSLGSQFICATYGGCTADLCCKP